jgi:hypothetical protein
MCQVMVGFIASERPAPVMAKVTPGLVLSKPAQAGLGYEELNR